MIRKQASRANQSRTRTYVSNTKRSAAGRPAGGAHGQSSPTRPKPRVFSATSSAGAHKKTRHSRPSHGSRNRAPQPNKDLSMGQGQNVPKLEKDVIRIIPVGGVEEIGRNMTLVEINDQIIIIDAGIEFADEDNPGINYMVPNTRYLEQNKHKIKALVITHGHLDHIGAIPYIIERIGNPTIYTREFGALLIKAKAEDFPGLKLDIKIAEKDDGAIPISQDLKVRFYGQTHSIPDSTGVIVETPHGDIVLSGDVRVENKDGVPDKEEFEQYAFFKNRNVLLMTMDSTGITAPGWAPSETAVVETIDEITKDAPGRVIIATFASQVERIVEFINIAKKYNRYVFIEGRSMKTNVSIARQLKLTDMTHVLSIEEIDNYPPNKVMMVATGGQGEEFAALARIANRTHKTIRLIHTDTVILSSSVVPGNEAAVDALKDNLYRSDARVVTYIDNVVHASGHGKREELAWIHRQIDYKFFMPIHGHYHRLKMHAELARSLGAKPENIVVPDDGSVIEIRDRGNTIVKLKEKVPSDPLIVDGLSVSDTQHLVIRDRKALAQDGIFMMIVMISVRDKNVKKSPDLISRGFVYLKENQELLKKARGIIKKTTEETISGMDPIDFDYVKDVLNRKVSKFLFQSTGKRPVVIPVVLSV